MSLEAVVLSRFFLTAKNNPLSGALTKFNLELRA
jgi:hypothetical protein